MKTTFLSILIFSVFISTETQPPYESVSMVNVLADPEAYHGKAIVTGGVLGVEDRGSGATAIFLTREHLDAGDYNSAIFIPFYQLFQKHPDAVKYHGKFVYVRGVFDADSGTYPQFVKLESIEPYEPLFEYESIE